MKASNNVKMGMRAGGGRNWKLDLSVRKKGDDAEGSNEIKSSKYLKSEIKGCRVSPIFKFSLIHDSPLRRLDSKSLKNWKLTAKHPTVNPGSWRRDLNVECY